MPQFVRDVEDLRHRARQRIEEGPVTNAYQGDKDRTISILNEALATEIVCVLRYMHHYFMATGVHGKSVADEFKEHADAERDHADQIAERIQQLGGKPDYNPKSLVERSASQYIEGETLADMIREDLIAERVVIDVYSQMIRYFGDKDPTTRVLMEGILKDEEEHAADLADLLYIVNPQTGKSEGVDPGTHPLELHAPQETRRQAGGRNQNRPQNGGRRQEGRREQQGRQERGGRQQQQGRREQESHDQQFRQQQGRREQRPSPNVQPQAGTTFAGSDIPNPPGPAGSRAARERERGSQRGRGGRKIA